MNPLRALRRAQAQVNADRARDELYGALEALILEASALRTEVGRASVPWSKVKQRQRYFGVAIDEATRSLTEALEQREKLNSLS